MIFFKSILPIIFLLFFIVGCNDGYPRSHTLDNPTPKDFLKNDDSDIFLFDGIVFSNAQDVKWVTDLEYKIGEQIGEITKQTDKAYNFKNGTANKLPVGTKIYATDTAVYIVIVNGEEIAYLKMIEG